MVYKIGDCIKHIETGEIYRLDGFDVNGTVSYRVWLCGYMWSELKYISSAIIYSIFYNPTTCPVPKWVIGDCLNYNGSIFRFDDVVSGTKIINVSRCINGAWLDDTMGMLFSVCDPLLTKVVCAPCGVSNIICLSGGANTAPGRIDIGYVWKNIGAVSGRFTPAILLDDSTTIPFSAELELAAGASSPLISGSISVASGTHKVCPVPN